ncbi:MAG: cytochrome c3 family protein [Nitrospirota bacterium]
MKAKLKRKFLGSSVALIVSFIFFGFSCPPADAEDTPCLECHVKFKEPAKNVHAALNMGCETCHRKEEGRTHPGEKKSIVLTQNMPKLCYGCHDESKFKGDVVHAPIAAGMCTGCHDPHQSDNGKILKEPLPEVCYTCHDKAKFTKKYVHNVINVVGCGSCHSPHVAGNPSLLPSSINDVCTTCHKGQSTGGHVVALPGKKFHPVRGVTDLSTVKWIKVPDPNNPKKEVEVPDPNVPGKELSCVSCHDPHSSDYKRLFTAQRLCLKCHKY